MPVDRTSEEREMDESEESASISANTNHWSLVRRRLLAGLPYRGTVRLGSNTLQRFVESDDERATGEDAMDWNQLWELEDLRDAQTNTTSDDLETDVVPRGFLGYSPIPLGPMLNSTSSIPSRSSGGRMLPVYAPSVHPNSRQLPFSISLSSSEMSSDLHPFLNPPSSEALFPCPEQWPSTTLPPQESPSLPVRLQQSRNRRRYLEIASHHVSEGQDIENGGSVSRLHVPSRRRLNRWPAAFEAFDGTAHTDEKNLDFSIPSFTSFLEAGREFKGFQRCTRREGNEAPTSTGEAGSGVDGGQAEDWIAHVRIKQYDAYSGYLCGTLKAYVKPGLPVVTFWEGEIIDNQNYTFKTNKWCTTPKTDSEYWTRFSAFRNLTRPTLAHNGMVPGLKEYPYIFMRWKETFFIKKTEENSLTIQGFYYICLCRATGEINGYYCDPGSNNPFQELELFPYKHGQTGFSFSHYEFK